MTIQFSDAEFPALRVPESNLLAVLSPNGTEVPPPTGQLTEQALDRPFGSERVEKLVSPSARVLILVDDITRQTPAAAVLPAVLRRIEGARVPRSNIRFLIAAGTHARMTADELERKLGAQAVKDYS
ncbi:MAG: lactate racemase domain-containing protein, partial [Terriglobia bacterium]